MGIYFCENKIYLEGYVISDLKEVYGVNKFQVMNFKLAVKNEKTGVIDNFSCVAPKGIVDKFSIQPGSYLMINGRIRSYSKHGKYFCAVQVLDVLGCKNECQLANNSVRISGYVCKKLKPCVYNGEKRNLIWLAVKRNDCAFIKSEQDRIPCLFYDDGVDFVRDLDYKTYLDFNGKIHKSEFVKNFEDGKSFVIKSTDILVESINNII